MKPIAITGLGCIFPGAAGVGAFWNLLVEGRDAVRGVNPESGEGRSGETPAWAGLLDNKLFFDPVHFQIAEEEVRFMDPQHRLLLEVAWQALEHSGTDPWSLQGSKTGVFVGIHHSEYPRLDTMGTQGAGGYAATGMARCMAANRISHFLNLRGPSWSVDTASSSSLVAVHQACASLNAGECDLALAGGVNLILDATLTQAYTRAGMLSARGRSRSFDESADGYVRGEGCGLVALKRMEDARAEGDSVLAEIRGSAVNQDGRTHGITVPSEEAQRGLIRTALAGAGIGQSEISYVEAHGSGTPLGDRTELAALDAVISPARSKDRTCFIGSVKSNIGHLEAAAGVAGLIKAVLALHRGVIPATLHFRKMNKALSSESRLEVPTRARPWPDWATTRYAGVSSFGLGGTNVHLVLAQADPAEDAPVEKPPALYLCLSAVDKGALQAMAATYAKAFEDVRPEEAAALCAASHRVRTGFACRLGIVAPSPRELGRLLAEFSEGKHSPGIYCRRISGKQGATLFWQGQPPPGPDEIWEGRGHKPDRARFEACWDFSAEPKTVLALIDTPKKVKAGEDSGHEGRLPQAFALAWAWTAGLKDAVPGLTVSRELGPGLLLASVAAGSITAQRGMLLSALLGNLADRLSAGKEDRRQETLAFLEARLGGLLQDAGDRADIPSLRDPSLWIAMARAYLNENDERVKTGDGPSIVLGRTPYASFGDLGSEAVFRRDPPQYMDAMIAFLYVSGVDIDWRAAIPVSRVDWEGLPDYPFRRKPYLLSGTGAEPGEDKVAAPKETARSRAFPEETPLSRTFRTAKTKERRRLLLEYVEAFLTRELHFEEAPEIKPNQALRDLGVDSFMGQDLTERLGAITGKSLAPTFVFDHPNLGAMVTALCSDESEKPGRGSPRPAVSPPRFPELVEERGTPVPERREPFDERPEPIAIVGMACRFPGPADSPERFWDLLAGGRDAVVEVPPDRWDVDRYFDPDPEAEGKTNTRHGGFLEDATSFDSAFFEISPREARLLDPQQRLLLAVAWQALEHAGIAPDRLAGSETGIFIGIGPDGFPDRCRSGEPADVDAYFGTGSATSVASGRLSYFFDVNGPNFSVDTACSSSLLAVHQACLHLRSGECDLALAGGVNLILTPESTVFLSKLRVLSADGRCKTFDASANGYVRGEGCGIVVLKRLSRALEDGDPVLAVIPGSAANHDGRSNGLTSPNPKAQEALIRQALKVAGLEPGDIAYLEAHGTGTALGDPIEVGAAGAVLDPDGGREHPLAIGSVKTNIGHLEAAAGIAGLIKGVLMLVNEAIPPHLHFKAPNPKIPWDRYRLRVPTELEPWKRGGRPRFLGVSSFGTSGTNVHVVLGEAGAEVSRRARPVSRPRLLAVSAKTEEGLPALAAAYARYLDRHRVDLAEFCRSVNAGRSHFPHRFALIGDDPDRLKRELDAIAAGGRPHSAGFAKAPMDGGEPCAVFLFTGQGAQYVNMARELYETHGLFHRHMRHCDAVLRDCGIPLLAERPLLSVLYPEAGGEHEAEELLKLTSYTQPALFAVESGLVALWRSWGVTPVAVAGHSVGEFVAAWTAGVFDLEDGLRLIAHRGDLIRGIDPPGGMAAVFAEEKEVRQWIVQFDRLALAAVNARREVVVSGDSQSLDAFLDHCRRQNVKFRKLTVSHAFHSRLLDPILDPFEALAETVAYRAPAIPVISNLTGEVMTDRAFDAAYWRDHLSGTVRFDDGMAALDKLDWTHLIEVGPKPTLLALAQRCLPHRKHGWLASLRQGKSDWRQLLESLAELYLGGSRIDWRRVDDDVSGHLTDLPGYPFHKRAYPLPKLVEPCPEEEPAILSERDLDSRKEPAESLNRLVAAHGIGARTLSRATGKDQVFLTGDRKAAWFLGQYQRSVTAIDYTGPAEVYKDSVTSLKRLCDAHGFQLNILEEDDSRAPLLAAMGYSVTPMGTWQSIEDISAFTLEGGPMRRLRYCVNKYKASGDVAVRRYQPGNDGKIDRQVAGLIEGWATNKTAVAGFVHRFKAQILAGEVHPRYRLYVTFRAAVPESLIVLTPSGGKGGFLMDMEFYGPEVPFGCLEYGIVEIIGQLNREGFAYFGFGLTPGTQIAEHPNADPAVRNLFLTLHRKNLLNNDGNFQFKSKFRPVTVPACICRPPDSDPGNVGDIVQMFASPEIVGPPLHELVARKRANLAETLETGRVGQSHPLLGGRLALATGETVFETRFSQDEPPYLADHRIAGATLFPATGYCEMARAGVRQTVAGNLPIEELTIHQPLILTEGKSLRVQMIVESGQAPVKVKILGRDEESPNAWTLHAEAVFAQEDPSGAEGSVDVAALRKAHTRELKAERFYAGLQDRGFGYGDRFQRIEQLFLTESSALGSIENGFVEDLHDFHPAVLDAGLQLGLALIADGSEPEAGMFLPIVFESLRILGRPPRRVWGLAELLADPSDESRVIALTFFDEGGKVLARCGRILFKRLSPGSLSVAEPHPRRSQSLFHRIAWRPKPLREDERGRTEGFCLILADEGGVGKALGRLLMRSSGAYALASRGQSFEILSDEGFSIDFSRERDFVDLIDLLKEITEPGSLRIVHLWSLDMEREAGDPLAAQAYGCRTLLYLVKALASLGWEEGVKIWIATRQSQGAEGASPGYWQAPVWGMGNVLAREMPGLECGLIDLDASDSERAAACLLETVWAADGERLVAYREGARHVRRMLRSPRPEAHVAVRGDRTYLISGGLGWLGRETMDWLVKRGARHLVLAGRGLPDDRIRARIEAAAAEGLDIRGMQIDVTREEEVRRMLDEIEREMPPLAGVIHAAGVLDDGVLLGQTWSGFLNVMAPKVLGAWNLSRMVNAPLDFFMLFSSATVHFGTPGQANYAAGNAFMEGLARYLCEMGAPAVAIGWGPWSGGGMASAMTEAQKARWLSLGIGELEKASGLNALGRCLELKEPVVGIFPLDTRRLASAPEGRQPLFRELLGVGDSGSAGSRPLPENSLTGAVLNSLDEAARRARIAEWLRGKAAKVLGAAGEEVDLERALNKLGMDSLMLMELRNTVLADLNVNIPVITFFNFPSILELSEIISKTLQEEGVIGLEREPGEEGSGTVSPAEVDRLSDREVDVMLNRLMAEREESG